MYLDVFKLFSKQHYIHQI